jgi:protease-4
LDAAGITVDEISFSEGFRNTSSFRDLDENAKKRYEQNLDETYDLFLSKVVSGRQIEYHHLKNNIAGGRVWSGEDALELGLLDKLGRYSTLCH